MGWVDIQSAQFHDILRRCVGLVYASSSEGQAGTVVTAMHAGLIPVVSNHSGVTVDDFGFPLRECTIAAIQETVSTMALSSPSELRDRSRSTWEYARAHFTREQYAKEYRSAITNILATYGRR